MTDTPKSFLDDLKLPEPIVLTDKEGDLVHDLMENTAFAVRETFQAQIKIIRADTDMSQERRDAIETKFREEFQSRFGISAYNPWMNTGIE